MVLRKTIKEIIMYSHLFGPVPSRRLGISLGIDLVPLKTCTLNCICCECERTTDFTLERKEYIPFEAVKKELHHYLTHNPKPDYITFSGSGEPVTSVRSRRETGGGDGDHETDRRTAAGTGGVG